jgi:two-component system, OmpR family, phosphate regulon response regulator OmpR
MSQDRAHLLVVDDDSRLRELLRKYLSDNGFIVTLAKDAEEARLRLGESAFDLVVLDVMMPGETGFELTRSIRDDPYHPAHHMPILLLTAMAESDNRIEGLESGADDYLAKPFEPKELVLRIQKIIKRAQQPLKASKIVNLGEYSFDVERAELMHKSQTVGITTAEANLLKILALSPGRTYSRDDLAARTGVTLSPRTIDVQVTRLRRRIEPDPRLPTFIKTVRHKGYVLWPG